MYILKSYRGSIASEWLVSYKGVLFVAAKKTRKTTDTDFESHSLTQVTAGSASQWHFWQDTPTGDINE